MNYDLSLIRPEFLSLIKFQRGMNVNNLDSDLIGVTGKYYNVGVNPLITLKNLEAFSPLSSDVNVGAYSASVTYSKGDYISQSGNFYRSIVNSNLNNAVTSTSHWLPTTLFSIWIREKIYAVFDEVLGETMLADKLLDSVKLYNITDDADLLSDESRFVGFEIRPKNSDHIKIVLNKIGTQFSEDQSTLNIYVRNQNTLVATIALTDLTAGEFEFTDITDQEFTGEGRWFIYYDQNHLTGKAHNWPIMNPSALADIHPFSVANTTTDFVNEVQAYSVNSYGLALDFSIFADTTGFIIKNKQAFTEAIHLQWQYDTLEMFLLNPDVQISQYGRNIDRDEVRSYLIGELRSDSKNSLISRLQVARHKLRKSLKFNDPALPGDNESTITFNSIG